MTDTQQETHRIVRLQVRNYKCLRAVDIIPSGRAVSLAGKNAQGKSSILDAILAILAGKRAMPERPIRDGASTSESEMDLGDMVAKLRITSRGSTLKLTSKTGVDISSPAKLLAEYSNEILLDLVGFIRKSETPEGRRKQAELLRKLVGLDFTSLDAKKQQGYDARTAINRDADLLRGKMANFPYDTTAPAEEIKVSDLMARSQTIRDAAKTREQQARDAAAAALEAVRQQNATNDKLHADYDNARNAVAATTSTLQVLLEEVRILEQNLKLKKDSYTNTLQTLKAQESAMGEMAQKLSTIQPADPAPIIANRDQALRIIATSLDADLVPIHTAIATADSTNQKVRSNRRNKELQAELSARIEQAEALTRAIDNAEKEKQRLLSDAKFPMPNLSFDESGILLNGLPLSQGSTAQQLKAAAAIGFALKPKIPVVIVRDGALLDDDSKAELYALLEQFNGQAWIEETIRDGHVPTGALVIEDGSVKE